MNNKFIRNKIIKINNKIVNNNIKLKKIIK